MSASSSSTSTTYHLVVARNGVPLAVQLSAANTHDSTQAASRHGSPDAGSTQPSD